MQKLQDKLSYNFSDADILIQALTHKSFGYEKLQHHPPSLRDNERLEFLADSVLGLIVSDLLVELFPFASEGDLTKMRAAVDFPEPIFPVMAIIILNAVFIELINQMGMIQMTSHTLSTQSKVLSIKKVFLLVFSVYFTS